MPEARGRFRIARHHPLGVQQRPGLEGLVRRMPEELAIDAELRVTAGQRPSRAGDSPSVRMAS